jgi:hypothetical protein
MLKRLRRPGYIAIALIVTTIYFYGQYKKREIKRHKDAILNIYKSYGEDILGSLKENDLSKLQSSFDINDKKSITLEDIATFVATLHLDKVGDAKWNKIEAKDGNISMSGDLLVDNGKTYPIDMMIVKRQDKLILKKMIINGQALQTKKVNFPLDRWFEANSSNQDKVLINKCNSLNREISSSFLYEKNSSNSK